MAMVQLSRTYGIESPVEVKITTKMTMTRMMMRHQELARKRQVLVTCNIASGVALSSITSMQKRVLLWLQLVQDQY